MASPANRPARFQMPVSPSAIVVLLLFLLVLIGLQPLSHTPPKVLLTGGGDVPRQVAYSLVFLATLGVSGVLRNPRRILVLPISLTLTLTWFLLSVTWAIDPDVSIRRLALTAMIILTVFLSVRTTGAERTVSLVRLVLMLVLVLNYLAVAVAPEAIHQAAEMGEPGLVGDWRGILAHKNFTGPICAFTIIFYLFGPGKIRPWLKLMVIAASAYFLYRTGSKTSEGALGLGLAVGMLFKLHRPKYRALILPAIAIVLSATVLLGQKYIGVLIEPYTRQDAFTGRGQIWPVLLRYATDHPTLGAGYGSFWNIGKNSPVYLYSKSWVTGLGNGHSGYLDILVATGLPGLILAVNAAIVAPTTRLLSSLTLDPRMGSLLLASLVFSAVHNATETTLFERDMVVQVFLMLTIALVGAATPPPRRDEAPPSALPRRRPAQAWAPGPAPDLIPDPIEDQTPDPVQDRAQPDPDQAPMRNKQT